MIVTWQKYNRYNQLYTKSLYWKSPKIRQKVVAIISYTEFACFVFVICFYHNKRSKTNKNCKHLLVVASALAADVTITKLVIDSVKPPNTILFRISRFTALAGGGGDGGGSDVNGRGSSGAGCTCTLLFSVLLLGGIL